MFEFKSDEVIEKFNKDDNDSAKLIIALATVYSSQKSEIHRAAYYFRIGAEAQDFTTECQEALKSLAAANSENSVIAYHHAILLQDSAKLKALFEKDHDFHTYVRKYDLHRLHQEPWLKKQLLSIAQTPATDDNHEQCRLFLHVLLIIAVPEDHSKKTRAQQLQEAVESFNKVIQMKVTGCLNEAVLFHTCLRLNYELSVLPSKDKIIPVDLLPVMLRCLRDPQFLFNETRGLPAVLKGTSTIEASSKASLDFYTPYTRQKAAVSTSKDTTAENKADLAVTASKDATAENKADLAVTASKDTTVENKADLFDLQHYVELDRSKIMRTDERRQLRNATYDSIVEILTLFQDSPKPAEAKSDKAVAPDVKSTLTLILDNALAKEKSFSPGATQEFVTILERLKNNLDQLIFEYQHFSSHLCLYLTKDSAKNNTYYEMVKLLLQESLPAFLVCEDPKTLKELRKNQLHQIYTLDVSGSIPLHHAAKKGDAAGAELLLQQVAPYTQLQTKDKDGKSPRDYCLKTPAMLECLDKFANKADLFDYLLYFYRGQRNSGEVNYHVKIMGLLAEARAANEKSQSSPKLNEAITAMQEAAQKTKWLGFKDTEHTRILNGLLKTIGAENGNELLLGQYDKLVACYPYIFLDILKDRTPAKDEQEVSSVDGTQAPQKDIAARQSRSYSYVGSFYRAAPKLAPPVRASIPGSSEPSKGPASEEKHQKPSPSTLDLRV